MYRKELKFDTIAIHGGDEGKKADNSLNNPIFMTSTFTFDNLNHAEQTFSFKNTTPSPWECLNVMVLYFFFSAFHNL